MKKKFVVLLLLVLMFGFDAQAQCAMCRAVLESEASQSAAKGINDGIMYLMIFPYLLMAGVGYMIWRSRKKSRTE
jgi:hypothetical protein